MSQIKARLLSFYTKRLIRRRQTACRNVGFDQARTIGILYHGDVPKKQEVIHQLVTELEKLGKQVSTLCYVHDPKEATNFTAPTVTLRDIKLLGQIMHPQAQEFANTSFDYLYQVDLASHPVIDYLMARSKAKCRVGYYTASRAGLFEIMVSLAEKSEGAAITDLITQMLHYTQLLKTK